jgi:hypothetical protein
LLNWEANKIVFAGLREGNYVLGNNNNIPREHNAWRIYVVDADGSNLKQITFEDPILDLNQFNPERVVFFRGMMIPIRYGCLTAEFVSVQRDTVTLGCTTSHVPAIFMW